MTEYKTISRKPLEHPGMDFALLRDQGIKYLEKVASRVWTDFNTHDPGITILEELCYAITDLSYRLNFDIADLLTFPDTETGSVTHQFFYAHEILPVNPLTIEDYRKILIDIDGVKNAWLSWAGDPDVIVCECPVPYIGEDIEVKNLNGLYTVQIERDPLLDASVSNEQLEQMVEARLSGARNLCEDVSDIAVLEKEIVNIRSDIELSIDESCKTDGCEAVTAEKPGCDVDELLARIYFELEKHISPSIYHYSLLGMLEKGISVEDMFTGPKLENGFIDDSEVAATEKKTHLLASDLIHLILDIENVKNIRNLWMKKEPPMDADPTAEVFDRRKWQLELETDKVPYLKDIDTFLADCVTRIELMNRVALGEPLACHAKCNDDSYLERCYAHINSATDRSDVCKADCKTRYTDIENGIVFFKGDLPYAINPDRVKQFLEAMRIEAGASRQTDTVLAPPTGEYRELYDYESIQSDFPVNYGIGSVGLGSEATVLRQAQAKQLRAYLSFFDQILANYLAQLDKFKYLLSVHNQGTHTYFTQMLQADTEIGDLIDLGGDFESIEALLNSKGLLEETAESQCRRDRLLSHLLARFCDSFTDFTLALYKYELEQPCSDLETGESAQEAENTAKKEWYLLQKWEFLREYPELSSERGKSFDYRAVDPVWDTENVAGIKKRISKLINMQNFSRHTVVPVRCFNETFCELFRFYEGFHLLEHILLRPGAAQNGLLDWHLPVELSDGASGVDPYSFQLSFVFADHIGAYQGVQKRLYPPRCADSASPEEPCCSDAGEEISSLDLTYLRFKAFVEGVIHAEVPAHITPLIHWLPPDRMALFEYLYRLWLIVKAAAARGEASEKRAVEIGRIILRLLGVYPLTKEEVEDEPADDDQGVINEESAVVKLPMRLPVPVAFPEREEDWMDAYHRDCTPKQVPLPTGIYPLTQSENGDNYFFNTLNTASEPTDCFVGYLVRSPIPAVGLAQLFYHTPGVPDYELHPERGVELCHDHSTLRLQNDASYQFARNRHVAFFLVFRAWGVSDEERLLISKNTYTEAATTSAGFSVYIDTGGHLCMRLINITDDDPATDDDPPAVATPGIVNDGAWHGVLISIFNDQETTQTGCSETVRYTVEGQLFTDVGDAPKIAAQWEADLDDMDPPLIIGSDRSIDCDCACPCPCPSDDFKISARAQIVYLAAWSFDNTFDTLSVHKPLMDGRALDWLWTANRVPPDQRHSERVPLHKHTNTITLPTDALEEEPVVMDNQFRDDLVAKFHGGYAGLAADYSGLMRHRSQFPYMSMSQSPPPPPETAMLRENWWTRTDRTAVAGYAVHGPLTENLIVCSEHIDPLYIDQLRSLSEPEKWFATDPERVMVTPSFGCNEMQYDIPLDATRAPDGTASATRVEVENAMPEVSHYLWQRLVSGGIDIATVSIWVNIRSPYTRVTLFDVTDDPEDMLSPPIGATAETGDSTEDSTWVRLFHTYPVFRCFDLPRCPDVLSREDTIDGCLPQPSNLGLMLKFERTDNRDENRDLDVMIWGAQVEPAESLGPYIPAIQAATSCAYEIPLRHALSDYYVGNTGQVSFKMRLPFFAEVEDGETLLTLTGYNADKTRKVRIIAYLERPASCDSPEGNANGVLLVEHQPVGAGVGEDWTVMGACEVACEVSLNEENRVVFDWDFRPTYYDGVNENRAWLRLAVNNSESILTLEDLTDVDVICDFIAEYLNISGQAQSDIDFPADTLPRALFYDVLVSSESALDNITVSK